MRPRRRIIWTTPRILSPVMWTWKWQRYVQLRLQAVYNPKRKICATTAMNQNTPNGTIPSSQKSNFKLVSTHLFQSKWSKRIADSPRIAECLSIARFTEGGQADRREAAGLAAPASSLDAQHHSGSAASGACAEKRNRRRHPENPCKQSHFGPQLP